MCVCVCVCVFLQTDLGHGGAPAGNASGAAHQGLQEPPAGAGGPGRPPTGLHGAEAQRGLGGDPQDPGGEKYDGKVVAFDTSLCLRLLCDLCMDVSRLLS